MQLYQVLLRGAIYRQTHLFAFVYLPVRVYSFQKYIPILTCLNQVKIKKISSRKGLKYFMELTLTFFKQTCPLSE